LSAFSSGPISSAHVLCDSRSAFQFSPPHVVGDRGPTIFPQPVFFPRFLAPSGQMYFLGQSTQRTLSSDFSLSLLASFGILDGVSIAFLPGSFFFFLRLIAARAGGRNGRGLCVYSSFFLTTLLIFLLIFFFPCLRVAAILTTLEESLPPAILPPPP